MKTTKTPLYKIPVFEVRLIQSRRPLRLAETKLDGARTSARALHGLIGLTDREHFAALFINTQYEITGAHIMAIGAQHAISNIDVRVLLRAALAACASALVVGHNHPSGDATPSEQDLTTTAHMMRAAKILSVPILDHIIVTRYPGRFHSMFERDTLPNIDE